jgi:putative membrane protein
MAQLLAKAAPVFSRICDRMGWNGGGWLWMMLMMIIGTIIVVLIVYLLIKTFYRGEITSGTGVRESPMDIAKRRYAAGEITREEFERIRNDLKGSS